MSKPQTERKIENSDETEHTKVFISYSHDSTKHVKKVLEFSNNLRGQGIDCTIDQYEESPPEGWPRWMDKQISTSNFIIIICTNLYYNKIKTLDKTSFGKGVKWESLLLYSHLYHNGSMNYNYIPVVFDNDSTKFIPEPLRDSTYYDIEKDFEKLTNRLKGKLNIIKPNIGNENQIPSNHQKVMKPKKFPIRIEIDEKFENYTNEQKTALLDAISEFLKVDYSIQIDKIEKGSTLVYIKLTKSDIAKLGKGIEDGLFDSYKIRKIEVLEQVVQTKLSSLDGLTEKKHYETIFILNPVLSEAQTKETVQNLENYLISKGAEMMSKENWGLKKLAYPIQNKKSGYYYLFEFKVAEEIIAPFELKFRRDESVMRYLTVRLDKHAIAWAEKRRKASLTKKNMGFNN